MIALLLAQLVQGIYSDPGTAPPDVVVRGQRLEEAQAACVRGGCSTQRDVQLSIALAEQQLLNGKYVTAKRTLMTSVARNRGAAHEYPRAVASLYEAYGNVGFQEGDMRVFRSATSAQMRILRENLPANDEATSHAGLLAGDMWLKLGNWYNAANAYRSAERNAEERGHATVAMIASLRRVWLLAALGRRAQADQMLVALAARPASDTPEVRRLFAVARLRIAANRRDADEVDRLTVELAKTAGTRPLLIWAPPYETPAGNESGAGRFVGDPQPPGWDMQTGITWADIGFWIQPNGRTGEIEVLRGNASKGWTRPLITQIGARRYTTQAGKTSTGSYRIERFTYRGTYAVPIASFIRKRIGLEQLSVLDLTDTASDVQARTPS